MSFMVFAKTAMKNLFSKPATKQYPAVPAQYPERTRGHIAINIDECILCGMCQRKCPTGAITVDRGAKTWSIERFGCIQCGNCVNYCPKKCLEMQVAYTAPGAQKIVDTVTQPAKEGDTAASAAGSAPATSGNASAAPAPAGETRVAIDIAQCVLCGLCQKKCPTGAIAVDREAKTWTINRDECIQCGNCVSGCPKKCLQMEFVSEKPSGTDTVQKPAAPAASGAKGE